MIYPGLGERTLNQTGIGLLVAFLLFPGIGEQNLLAKTAADAVSEARAKVLAAFVPKVPGLAVAAELNGKIIWSEGFGFSDLAKQSPVTSETIFRIGSISKSLTAAGLMLLVEHKHFDLDADIHRYIPDYPDKGQTITTRQLAGHLAGVRHYRGKEAFLNRHFTSVRDTLTIFENDPLLFKPGEKFSYSTFGWNIVSLEMETASGKDFLAYMQEEVFGPLGLKHTMPDFAGRDIPNRTRFYNRKRGGGFKTSPTLDNSDKWAGGGFLSTPVDLVRFGNALLHPGFLTSHSLDIMFASQKTDDGKSTGYGIGWFIRRDHHGHPIYLNSGGSIGGTSILLLYPDSHAVLAMTSNCTSSPFDKADLDAVSDEFSGLVGADK